MKFPPASQPLPEDNYPFSVGDRVNHGTYENGTVIDLVSKDSVIVEFDGGRRGCFRNAIGWLNPTDAPKPLRLAAANDNNPPDRFAVDWFGDIEEDQPKEEIVRGVFGVDEFTMISGKPGSGKSVITTDLACHIAAGMDWHGRPVKQGMVAYIAAERRGLTKRRMMAFRKHHGVGNIPLALIGGRLDLTSTLADANAMAAQIQKLAEECGHPCVWIIIDTLTRTFGPGDQNASKDMTRFVQACDTIRETVTGSHLTVVHHTGWAGDRGKGAIDLDGAVDASFLVKKEGGAYVLECDGTNDGEEGPVTHFKMQGIQVGLDAETGEPTMAPVVIPSDGKSPASRVFSGSTIKALDALRGLSEDGEPVPMALWRSSSREAFDDGEKTLDALNKMFDRAKKTLIDDGTVLQIDGGFIPASAMDG